MTSSDNALISDEDYFLIKLYKSLGDKIGAKTLSGTRQLFMRFHYDELFTRENIKEIFNVQNSRASEIISILLKSNLIENAGDSKYKFKK